MDFSTIFKKITPLWSLRLGLGLVYLYSGSDLITHPYHWYGFVPEWFARAVTAVMPLEQYLRLQGMGEVALGIVLLAWFLPRWTARAAAAAAATEMAMILLLVGIDPVTFRDIGLFGAAVALLLLLYPADSS